MAWSRSCRTATTRSPTSKRDIRHFLSDEPIEHKRPSVARRLRLAYRRNRVVFNLIACFLILAVVGIAVYIQQIKSEQARTEAQRKEAVARRQEADAQRRKAEDEAQKAKAVTKFLQDMLGSVDPASARGHEVTVRMVLDWAAKKIGDKFQDQPLVEAAVRTTIGNTYEALGLYDAAEPHLVQAMKIRQRVLGKEDPDTLTRISHSPSTG